MDVSESFTILGVTSDVDERTLRSAWKHKAARLHPDTGGSHEAMIRLNTALEVALAALHRNPSATVEGLGESQPRSTPGGPKRYVGRDMSSFTIDALPVDAWQLLYMGACHCGPIVDEEEPYVLEFMLSDTSISSLTTVMCRCELVPEAGGTTVHLTLFSERGQANGVEMVRDLLVSAINELDNSPHF